ncbi:MAG: hypothetical protein AB7E13_06740 [Arcobacteraceae bacterium]
MKKLTSWTKIFLFLTSYSPLAIIYLIVDFDSEEVCYFTNPIWSLSAIVLIILLFIFTYLFFRHFNNSQDNENVSIVSVSNMDGELLSYIFTYILPFLGFPEDKKLIVSLFILVMIGFIYIRSNMIGINPIIGLFGYHIVKIEYRKDGWSKNKIGIFISKLSYEELVNEKKIKATEINQGIYLLKETLE